jgi:hypothetical protein
LYCQTEPAQPQCCVHAISSLVFAGELCPANTVTIYNQVWFPCAGIVTDECDKSRHWSV